METINGKFYPAGSSCSNPASLQLLNDQICLDGEGFTGTFGLDDVEFSDRLASLPRKVHFPGGGLFSTRDNTAIDRLLGVAGRAPRGSLISFFESGWRWTLLALVAIPVSLYSLFTLGMPIVAAPLAHAVPESIKNHLDVEIVGYLDKRLLEPSELSDEKSSKIEKLFSKLSWSRDMSLQFRKGGPLGANALALPGGTIIITDELVELVEFRGEFVAVIAHEAGHVQANHSMRNVFQVAGVSMVMSWMLGDMSLVTDIVLVGVPTLLQQLSYSRAFEQEADESAMFLLKYEGFPTACFSSIFTKLSEAHSLAENDFPSYLSTHPTPSSRIELGASGRPCSEGKSQSSKN